MRAALILRAPLLIRLRFAADPSGWRPRYHPLRFARIIRCAPRCAARDARTASRMPVPARRLEIADKRFNPRLPGGRRPLRSRPYRRDRPGRQRDDQSAGEPARSPHRARAGPLARMVARAPQDVHAHRHDPRQRFAPDAAQNAPGASQKPAPRARRSAGAYGGARTAGRSRPQTRSAPALRARRRPERARSQPEARTARAPVRWRVSWRAHRPAYQPATALRASASRQTPPGTRQEPATSSTASLLRLWTITDPV